MTLADRFRFILEWFRENRPVVQTELSYSTPYELLVATILSAQCTDKRVNMTTPAFFERFPTAAALAAVSPEEVFPYVKSISYPNNKAKNLVNMAGVLIAEFGGVVPSDPDALQKLPGVGRKTANVVASVIFNKAVIAVDTHVFRVARRLGLSSGKTPLKVEEDLSAHIPEADRGRAHHWLILHGRYVCRARRPLCDACGLTPWCRYYAKEVLAREKETNP